MASQVADQLVVSIKEHIVAQQLAPGTRLSERGLAEQFRVSRSPVREALKKLEENAIVLKQPEGGYVVGETPPEAPSEEEGASREEEIYLRIAQDRLAGELPERFTENQMMRRYGVTRAVLNNILRRMVQEGWAERLLGHGWAFLPTLSSSEAYNQGYRLRIVLEPAALLEPDYRLNERDLRRCLQEQQTLLDGGIEKDKVKFLNTPKWSFVVCLHCSE